jgi:hypothetical protein
MSEQGLPASDIGKEIVEHADLQRHGGHDDRTDRRLSIVEALLLALVALLAGWSGYAAAKWGTESRVELAHSSTLRTQANRAYDEEITLRNFDSSTFDAWFSAYIAKNQAAMTLAERRFRPNFRVAFDAWRATHPETNPNAPMGPTYMPEYRQPGLRTAQVLDARADRAFNQGDKAGRTADDYVRTTVFLAVVLFLVGISAHFPVRGGRYILIGLGGALLVLALVLVVGLPGPPS